MNVGSIVERIDNFQKDYISNEKVSEENVVKSSSGVEYREPTKAEILEVVNTLNVETEQLPEKISFSYHEKTHRIIMKVVDSKTNEIQREIPPKGLIKLLEHLQEYIGLFVDESI